MGVILSGVTMSHNTITMAMISKAIKETIEIPIVRNTLFFFIKSIVYSIFVKL
jgi:hypothetical protein